MPLYTCAALATLHAGPTSHTCPSRASLTIAATNFEIRGGPFSRRRKIYSKFRVDVRITFVDRHFKIIKSKIVFFIVCIYYIVFDRMTSFKNLW